MGHPYREHLRNQAMVKVTAGSDVRTDRSGHLCGGSGTSPVGSYNALITTTSASAVQTLTIPVTLTN